MRAASLLVALALAPGCGGKVVATGAGADAGTDAGAGVTCDEALDDVDGGIHEGCRGGDCPRGQVCCGCFGLSSGLAAVSLCEPSCAASDYQLCASSSECAAGDTCQLDLRTYLCAVPPPV